jgi:hypothetical protein
MGFEFADLFDFGLFANAGENRSWNYTLQGQKLNQG